MKKLILIAFTALSISSQAQTYQQVGNTLQRQSNGTYSNYRFNLGSPGFFYLYSKSQVDSLIGIATSGVSSFNGRTGAVVPLAGDYSTFYPQLSGSYANPSWLTSLAWSKITGTPTTLSGYGITDAITSTYFNANTGTSTQTQINAKQPQLNGTGFVKASGTTISYDNSTYLKIDGSNATGDINVGSHNISSSGQISGTTVYGGLVTGGNMVSSGTVRGAVLEINGQGFQIANDVATNQYEIRNVTGNNGARLYANGDVFIGKGLNVTPQGVVVSGNTLKDGTGIPFAKAAGTSSQFIKGDGTFDSNTYALLSAIPTNYITTNTTQTGLSGDKTSAGNWYFGNIGLGTTSATSSITLGNTSTGIANYLTSDQVTNYERVRNYWNSTTYTIGTEAGGTGVQRNMQIGMSNGFGIGLSPAAGFGTIAQKIQISSGSTATTYGILGITGTFAGTTVPQTALAIPLNVNQSSSASYKGLWIPVYEQSLGSGPNYLIDAGTTAAASGSGAYTSKFSVDNSGKTTIANTMIAPSYQIGLSGILSGNGVGSNVTSLGTVLPVANGGNGTGTYATGDIIYASAANTLSKRTIGSTNNVLTVVGGVPTWAAPSFSNPMTTLGDIPYGGASGTPTRLAGETSTTRKFLSSIGVAGAAIAPSFFDLYGTSGTWGAQQTFNSGIQTAGVSTFNATTNIGYGQSLVIQNSSTNAQDYIITQDNNATNAKLSFTRRGDGFGFYNLANQLYDNAGVAYAKAGQFVDLTSAQTAAGVKTWTDKQIHNGFDDFNLGSKYTTYGINFNQSGTGSPSISFLNTAGTFSTTLGFATPTVSASVTIPNKTGVISLLSDVPTALRLTGSGTGAATTISIAHGLTGVTSSSVAIVSPINAASSGISYITTDATNINIVYTVAPASGTNNLSYNVIIKQ